MPSRTTHDRRVRSGAAVIAAGALLAALLPAAPAQAAATTTVHGTVQSGSTRLAGVPVGFWSRTGKRLASATTGSTGAFTLHVPSGVRGFAYAGARPDASRAIFSVGTRAYVRGVIGASQGSTASYRIYQGHTSATAAHLAGGATLRFKLQKPGRVKVLGGKYFRTNGDREGGFGVLRLNGGFLHETSANPSTGTAWSQWLVAGHYRVRYFPNPPYLGRTVSVTVPAGGTATLQPSFPRGATVHGVLTGSDGKPAAGVRVIAAKAGAAVDPADVTDAQGRYSIPALTAGDYRLRIGYNPAPDPESAVDMEDDQFKPPTSDDYVARTVPFSVGSAHADVSKNLTLASAGHVRGTVSGAGGPLRVWLETTTGRIIRTGAVTDGAYELGGLRPGASYRLYATSASTAPVDSTYGEVDLTATSGVQTKDIALTKATLTLTGAVTGGRATSVSVRSAGEVLPAFDRRFASDSGSSTYTVRGLIPGQYDVTVGAPGTVDSKPQLVSLTASPTTVEKDLAAGRRTGTYVVRFVSGAAPLLGFSITAADKAGDLSSLWVDGGTHRATDTPPAGTYHYVASSFRDNGPVDDGPWWFGPVSHTFTVTAGRTTNDGTVAVHVRSSL